MKLIKAHVTNFRSVEDSEPFSLDQVTCLVGKNEAGKSAILLALAALHPHPATPATLDKERDYPRRYLTAYVQRNPEKEAVAVSTTWELEKGEIDAITKELGKDVLTATPVESGEPKPPRIKVLRRYGAVEPEWEISVNLPKAFDFLLANRGFDDAQVVSLKAAKNTEELIARLAALPAPTAPQQKLIEQLKGYGTISARIKAILFPGFPSFMYFSNYDRMEGAVQIEQLQTLKANGQLITDEYKGHRLFMEFLEYAGAPIDSIAGVATFETFNALLQAASNNITDQILEYWTQNPDLSVKVEIDPGRPGDRPPLNSGNVARARIHNALHRVDTPFSERSAGFVWFFSFLVKFAQVKAQGTPVILLLDEPGLTLHGKAQADLLRYFEEKLAPHHQIVYSTHSPFMVAPDKLLCARIVEDQVEIKGQRRLPIGTKVRDDILSRDPDTLFPLQGALGFDLTQSLFVGKHTLLVEGPSDILYLQALSSALKARSRTGLDSRWTLCPSGGIGNIRSFVSLFGGNNLDIAVLTDFSKTDHKKLEELRRSAILQSERIYTAADFTGKKEADVEDLFDPTLFAAIVNAAYALVAPQAVTSASLAAADQNTERLVKQTEATFKLLPENIPMYDHFTPAAWLIRNPSILDDDKPEVLATLDRAEKVFATFNAML
jgi:energy-coupling factor transporter ATP-binding protein EcfA2